MCAAWLDQFIGAQNIEEYQKTCDCTGDATTGFDIACRDGCLTSTVDGIQYLYTEDLHLVRKDGSDNHYFYDNVESCLQFFPPDFDGKKVCFLFSFDQPGVVKEQLVTFDGEACNSIVDVTCNQDDLDAPSGFQADCSNLGYGEYNSCDEGLDSPTSSNSLLSVLFTTEKETAICDVPIPAVSGGAIPLMQGNMGWTMNGLFLGVITAMTLTLL